VVDDREDIPEMMIHGVMRYQETGESSKTSVVTEGEMQELPTEGVQEFWIGPWLSSRKRNHGDSSENFQ
jgi:hypothetical protein